jgi:hypothetical protein
MTRTLGQQRSTIGDDVANRIVHTFERFNNRITLNNPEFGERHVKRQIYILVRLRIGDIDEEFVACFQRIILSAELR